MTLCAFFFIISVFCIQLTFSVSENGWKMVDRFKGFRYSIENTNKNSLIEIQQKADELACFGWAQQLVKDKKTVGEIRCSKIKGVQFQNWLTSTYKEHVVFKDYEDTKIRLHFSSFKILDENRDTCFPDSPHKCADIDNNIPNTGSNEL